MEAIASLTTLGRTIVKGRKISEGTAGAYHRLRWGRGEDHITLTELAGTASKSGGRRSLLNFVHFTDIHIVDAQSPARVEFLAHASRP